jgi:hypothetical protein
MIKLLGILGDLLVAGVVLGAGLFVVRAASGGPQGGAWDGIACGAFVILFLASGAVAVVRAWGAWDSDISATRLGRIYRMPFLNAVVAYYRLRTGQGFVPRKEPRRFPWSDPEGPSADNAGLQPDGDGAFARHGSPTPEVRDRLEFSAGTPAPHRSNSKERREEFRGALGLAADTLCEEIRARKWDHLPELLTRPVASCEVILDELERRCPGRSQKEYREAISRSMFVNR